MYHVGLDDPLRVSIETQVFTPLLIVCVGRLSPRSGSREGSVGGAPGEKEGRGYFLIGIS